MHISQKSKKGTKCTAKSIEKKVSLCLEKIKSLRNWGEKQAQQPKKRNSTIIETFSNSINIYSKPKSFFRENFFLGGKLRKAER